MKLRAMLPAYRSGNRIIIGTTRCGKSTAMVLDIMAAVMLGMAVIVIDPHEGSLSWNVYLQIVAAGLESRVLFDRIGDLKHFLGYRFLRKSQSPNEIQRNAQDEQSRRELVDVFLRRRDVESIAGQPLTEEYLLNAMLLVQQQRVEQPASDIQFAFEPEHRRFHELIQYCTRDDIQAKFKAIAEGKVKAGQYASAARLIRSICSSPAFVHRCTATFDLHEFLDHRGVLLLEGASSGVSTDAANMILGSVVLQVLQYVRSRKSTMPRVLLVMDESTNANLIGSAGHEVRALAELQKKGLDIFIMVQAPSFPSSFIEEGVFTNCVEHQWFYNSNASVAEKAARDLGDPSFRDRVRNLHRGERFIRRLSTVTFDRVTPLPDPWAFPGLAEAKAYRALARMHTRSEFWSPTCSSKKIQTEPNYSLPSNPSPNKQPEMNKSSDLPTNTSVSQGTSVPCSPADRLRIARSTGSAVPDSLGASERSS